MTRPLRALTHIRHSCGRPVLVLGATGMIGQALLKELEVRGLPAVGVARRNAEIRVDLTDSNALADLIESTFPGVIVNCAANVNISACERDPAATYLINTRTVGILARLCTRMGINLVQISTDHYYTGDGDRKHTEDEPVTLTNEYTSSKFLAEELAKTAPNALIVRTNVIGFRNWNDHPTFLEWVMEALRTGSPMTLFTDYFTSSLDAATFCRALMELVQLSAQGVINLASSEVSSKKRFIEMLACRIGLPLSDVRDGSVVANSRVRRNESLGLDVSRAESLLGYTLPSLTQVIDNLICETKVIGSITKTAGASRDVLVH